MIAGWAEQYATWFESTANVAWFVGFWLFVIFLLGLEIRLPAFQRSHDRSDRWPTNFGLGAMNAGLLVITPVSTISSAEWASRARVGILNEVTMPFWVSVCVTLAVYSLTVYLIHLVEHKTPWLWRLHRVHHLDTHLDVSTSQRHHPLEFILYVLILVAVTIVFGLATWAVIIY